MIFDIEIIGDTHHYYAIYLQRYIDTAHSYFWYTVIVLP